ncbi:MAG: hypothetical protein ACJ761_03650 [Chloroflexota bacterium]
MTERARSETTGTEERAARDLRPPLSIVDPRMEAESLLGELHEPGRDRTSKTLLKAGPLRIVLTALEAGAEIEDRDPDETVAIQAVDGRATVEIEDRGDLLESGRVAALPPGAPWRVRAETESILLLFVGRRTGSEGNVTRLQDDH